LPKIIGSLSEILLSFTGNVLDLKGAVQPVNIFGSSLEDLKDTGAKRPKNGQKKGLKSG
jgi:hypothetical protein